MAKPANRYVHPLRNPPGTSPGTLTVDPAAGETKLRAMILGADGLRETDTPDLTPPPDGQRLWLAVEGLGDRATLQRIASAFNLHPLAMEDVVDRGHRPKTEEYDQHLFIILRAPDPQGNSTATEQIALFLTDRVVITFQENARTLFDPVRTRLRNPGSSLRVRGEDYLAYALIDAAIDAFFPRLERIGERLEEVEDAVITQPKPIHIRQIHTLKNELTAIRSAVWPTRDLLSALLRDDTSRFANATKPYLRDAQDNTFHIIDMVTMYHEIAVSLVDIYLSSLSNRANEVMRVLTLIATIFIPLTFVVGVYGMNFDTMPELRWRWGYPVVMALMAAIAGALVWWFWRRGWLGRG